MSAVLMQLGDFQFTLNQAALQTLRRTQNQRWAFHEPLGASPGGQYLGEGEDSIGLEGIVYPGGGVGNEEALENLQTLAQAGEALSLLDASGVVWGDFAIVRLEQNYSHYTGKIGPRKIAFRLELKKITTGI